MCEHGHHTRPGHIFFFHEKNRTKHHHPQGQGSGGVPRSMGVTLLKSCALCDSLDYFLALRCCSCALNRRGPLNWPCTVADMRTAVVPMQYQHSNCFFSSMHFYGTFWKIHDYNNSFSVFF